MAKTGFGDSCRRLHNPLETKDSPPILVAKRMPATSPSFFGEVAARCALQIPCTCIVPGAVTLHPYLGHNDETCAHETGLLSQDGGWFIGGSPRGSATAPVTKKKQRAAYTVAADLSLSLSLTLHTVRDSVQEVFLETQELRVLCRTPPQLPQSPSPELPRPLPAPGACRGSAGSECDRHVRRHL